MSMDDQEQEITDNESFGSDSEEETKTDPTLDSLMMEIKKINIDNVIEQLEHVQQMIYESIKNTPNIEYNKVMSTLTKRLGRLSDKIDGFVPFIDDQIKDILFDIQQTIPKEVLSPNTEANLSTSTTAISKPETTLSDTQWYVPELDISNPEAQVDLNEKFEKAMGIPEKKTIPIEEKVIVQTKEEKPSSMPRLSEFKPELFVKGNVKKQKSKHSKIRLSSVKPSKKRPESVRRKKKVRTSTTKNEGKKKYTAS
jgi:hypothetical protein